MFSSCHFRISKEVKSSLKAELLGLFTRIWIHSDASKPALVCECDGHFLARSKTARPQGSPWHIECRIPRRRWQWYIMASIRARQILAYTEFKGTHMIHYTRAHSSEDIKFWLWFASHSPGSRFDSDEAQPSSGHQRFLVWLSLSLMHWIDWDKIDPQHMCFSALARDLYRT